MKKQVLLTLLVLGEIAMAYPRHYRPVPRSHRGGANDHIAAAGGLMSSAGLSLTTAADQQRYGYYKDLVLAALEDALLYDGTTVSNTLREAIEEVKVSFDMPEATDQEAVDLIIELNNDAQP